MKKRLTERVLFHEMYAVNNLPTFGLRYGVVSTKQGTLIYHPDAIDPFLIRLGDKAELNIRCATPGAIEIMISVIGEADDGS